MSKIDKKQNNRQGRKSISRLISLWLFIITLFVFIAAEAIILERSYNSILIAFDINLHTRVETLASLTEIDDTGVIEFNLKNLVNPAYTKPDAGEYFIILSAKDNSEISSSRLLNKLILPVPRIISEHKFQKTYYWNDNKYGRKIRSIAYRAVVKPDPDEVPESLIEKYSQECIFITGMDMRETNERFYDIFKVTSLPLGIGLILLLIMEKYILRKYLKPLNEFSNEVRGISPTNLNPVSIPAVAEIATIADTLNKVIGNLREAFSREQRFTSNVAHELRTPISEIRTLVEVILNYPEGLDKDDIDNYTDILESVKQMQNIVNNLLILTRFDSNSLTSQEEQFDVNILITAAWDRYRNKAAQKNVTLEKQIPDPFAIFTDREMFKTIIDNLISNAIEYSEENSSVEISGTYKSDCFYFSIINRVNNLASSDIPLMFERFWRKDEVRSTNNNHCGLGLSLVQSIGSYLEFDIHADLDDENQLRISISGYKKTA